MNTYKVTKKMYLLWTKEAKFRDIKLIIFISWIILLILSLIFLKLSLSFIKEDLTYAFLFSIMTLFSAYRAFFRDFIISNRQYNILKKIHKMENWTRKIIFDENEIYIKEEIFGLPEEKWHSSVINYGDIMKIREKDNNIWIDLKSKSSIRLYKDCFIDTNSDIFFDMIMKKVDIK